MLSRATAAAALKNPVHRRRALLLVLALGLSTLPLVGTLGYESALVFAPILSIMGALFGVDALRSARERGGTLASVFSDAAFQTAVAWALVVATLLLGMLWQRNCDPLAGVLFFVIGPAFSAGLSVVAGVAGAALVPPTRPRLMVVAALTPFVLCLVLSLWRLYVGPAVFALDPFWGHFAGPLYDEDVNIGDRYLRFRAYNALAAAGVVLALAGLCDPVKLQVARRLVRPRLLALGAVALLGAAAVFVRAPHHGFHVTVDHVAQHVLPRTRASEHFIIHYAPGTATAREIDTIVDEHEFAFAELEGTLGITPKTPIRSFIFDSPDHKRAVIGAGRVEVAPPWRRHLYLNHRPFPHSSLPHELAHAFESAIGDPLFGLPRSGLSINMGLVEGLATAVAPRPNMGLHLHDQAAVMDRLERRPPLSAVVGSGFWGQASGVAYTAAGSFVAYLLETHGAPAVLELYRSGGDFQGSLGASLGELEADWIAFLRARELPPDAVEAQRQRFAARPVFARPCAHRVFDLHREAGSARRRGDRDEAIEARKTLCTLEPELPEHKLTLADEHAGFGEFGEAAAVLRELAQDTTLTSTLRAATYKRLGQVALRRGDLAAAREAFSAALSEPVHDNEARVLALQLIAASDPELAPLVAEYFGHYDPDDDAGVRALLRMHIAHRIRALPGQRALGNYLLGLQLMNASAHEEAVAALERARDPGPAEPPLPPRFAEACELQLLSAYVLTDRLARARAVLADLRARTDPPRQSGDTLVAEQWERRLNFLDARRGPGRSVEGRAPQQGPAPARLSPLR